jgi:1-acyl-sn-glycerol-3-phosphate acyltransferase
VFKTPFLASLVARVGGVRACRENAERLLASDEVVAVFPEGIRGMRKPFRDRYQLQRFGRGGFVTLALATGVPIVPVAIVGAEETHPLLGTWRWPAKVLGVPYFPITPTFPWLGLLGLVPLPSKWSIRFGRPIDLARRYRPEDAADPVLVDRLVEDVRETVQVMVDQDRKARGNAF